MHTILSPRMCSIRHALRLARQLLLLLLVFINYYTEGYRLTGPCCGRIHKWSVSSSNVTPIVSEVVRTYCPETWNETMAALGYKYSDSASGLVMLCDYIDSNAGKTRSLGILRYKRKVLLTNMLRRNRDEYIAATSFLGSRIPRDELPNVQAVPLHADGVTTRTTPGALLSDADQMTAVEDCTLPSLQYRDSVLDRFLLARFRSLVQKEIGFKSETTGIRGLLEEGRHFMLSVRDREDGPALQHRYVQKVLDGMLPPMLPALFRLFMSGLVPSTARGDPPWLAAGFHRLHAALPRYFPGRDLLQPGRQLGPWFYAPYLTSLVSPLFLTFLIGPCRANLRKDGQRGGMVVEKCKFLQESNCKGLCLHQCKLPAQQYFQDTLGLPLSVTPNFATQECQWSWGEAPAPHEQDPEFPKGCIRGCGTRQMVNQSLRRERLGADTSTSAAATAAHREGVHTAFQ